MQFLKTLFWVALAVILVLFATRNWTPVTLNLWGGLQADIKLPVLVFAAFLLGLLPTLILHRARIWALKRRLEPHERNLALSASAAAAAPAATMTNAAGADPQSGERVATDTKIWP